MIGTEKERDVAQPDNVGVVVVIDFGTVVIV
jgi:hypothetical protein